MSSSHAASPEPAAPPAPAAASVAAAPATPISDDLAAQRSAMAGSKAPELRLIGRYVRLKCRGSHYDGLVALITKDTVVLAQVVKRTPEEHTDLCSKVNVQAAFAADLQNRTLLPFITFLRKSVKHFEPTEPRSAPRYDGDPPHPQIIRAHVRRFVIHTDLGNNPTNMSLPTFVTQRSGWTSPDATHFDTMATEERAAMDKIAAVIAASRASTQSAGASASRNGQGGANRGREPALTAEEIRERAAIRQQLAMEDAFAESKLLSRSSYVATAQVVLSVTTLLYIASTLSTIETTLEYRFLSQIFVWPAISGGVNLAVGAASAIQAFRVKFPSPSRFAFLVRVIFLLGGFALGVTSAVVLLSAAVNSNDPFVTGASLRDEFLTAVRNAPSNTCSSFNRLRCSGYDAACNKLVDVKQCPVSCATRSLAYSQSCGVLYTSEVQSLLIALLVVTFLSLAVHMGDLSVCVRFVRFMSTAGVTAFFAAPSGHAPDGAHEPTS